jgi:hypothetical protein
VGSKTNKLLNPSSQKERLGVDANLFISFADMKKKKVSIGINFILFCLLLHSCQNVQNSDYIRLVIENDSLKKELAKSIPKQKKEVVNNESDSLIKKIVIVKIATGYDPKLVSSNFSPCVSIKFKNLSNNDIKENVKVTAIFIDNDKGEQFGTKTKYFISPSEPLLSNMTKHVGLICPVGMTCCMDNFNISVKVYVNDNLIQTLKVTPYELDASVL